MNVGSTRILRAAALRTIRSVSLKWIGPSSVGWPSDHENTIRALSAPAAAIRGNCALQILVGEWAIESPKFMPMNCFGTLRFASAPAGTRRSASSTLRAAPARAIEFAAILASNTRGRSGVAQAPDGLAAAPLAANAESWFTSSRAVPPDRAHRGPQGRDAR